MAVWIPVTVVFRSAATDAIDTFITELSSVIRNCADARTSRTRRPPSAAAVTTPAPGPPVAGVSLVRISAPSAGYVSRREQQHDHEGDDGEEQRQDPPQDRAVALAGGDPRREGDVHETQHDADDDEA